MRIWVIRYKNTILIIYKLLVEENPKIMIHNVHHVKLCRKSIAARNDKQANFLDAIDRYAVTFAVGPAGTGKTYLAVSKAIQSFEKGEVHRLILSDPL